MIYQSLLAKRRKDLHGAIGRALEDLYANRRDEHAPILAYHYARSEQHEKAIEYALLAGDQAARLYANAEATTYYEQALTMARGLLPAPSAHCAEIDAALKLAAVVSAAWAAATPTARINPATVRPFRPGD